MTVSKDLAIYKLHLDRKYPKQKFYFKKIEEN
jgi:hypothetical protein